MSRARQKVVDPELERELEHERGQPWKVLTDSAEIKAAIPDAVRVYVRADVAISKEEAIDLLTNPWRKSRTHKIEASLQYFSSDNRRYAVCIYGLPK